MKHPWLEATWKSLYDALVNERLGHALLLSGPAGLGKTELAERLVARMLCLTPGEDACGVCDSCRLAGAGAHPDRCDIAPDEPGAAIRVDPVRELAHRLRLTARMSPARVAVIRQADRLNINAANALLKTLEEPPEGAWLVLITDHPGRLPVTVRSRCMPVTIRPPEPQAGRAWLEQAVPDADPATRERALAMCGGAPLAARDRIESGDMAFGSEVLEALAKPGRDLLNRADDWSAQAESAWAWCARWSARALRVRFGVGDDVDPRLERLARRHPDALVAAYDGAVAGLAAVQGPVRQDLRLADWLLQWQQQAPR